MLCLGTCWRCRAIDACGGKKGCQNSKKSSHVVSPSVVVSASDDQTCVGALIFLEHQIVRTLQLSEQTVCHAYSLGSLANSLIRWASVAVQCPRSTMRASPRRTA